MAHTTGYFPLPISCGSYVRSSDLSTQPLTKVERDAIRAAAADMGARALRVLALASGPSITPSTALLSGGVAGAGAGAGAGINSATMSPPGATGGLCFAGLAGIMDPPRDGVAASVAYLLRSGVHVAMITGDAVDTATAVASQIGLVSSQELPDPLHAAHSPLTMTGAEIEALDEATLADRIAEVRVFYRTAPRHKMAIVRAFQRRGEVVGMTGDGVNDAPALKVAEIGVALGKTGTDVSREVKHKGGLLVVRARVVLCGDLG